MFEDDFIQAMPNLIRFTSRIFFVLKIRQAPVAVGSCPSWLTRELPFQHTGLVHKVLQVLALGLSPGQVNIPTPLVENFQQSVKPALVNRHHGLFAYFGLGVVGNRQTGSTHHWQIIGTIAHGNGLA